MANRASSTNSKFKFSLEEFSRKRTPKELLDWSRKQFEKIRGVKDKKTFFQRKGLTKVLIEEIHPIAIFCVEYYRERNVLIKPNLGDENYDAIVYEKCSKEEKVVEKIEVTQAIEGYQESMRREVLAEGKPVPFTGPIQVKLIEKGRVIEAELSGGSVYPLIEKIIFHAKSAIEKKISKNYETGTILLVVLNSLPIIPTSFIGQGVKNAIEISKNEKTNIFSKIFLINEREEAEKGYATFFL